ncbi:leucine-rich repeat protein, partial [Levilactobacillus spicheri]
MSTVRQENSQKKFKKIQESKYWVAAALAVATLGVGTTSLQAKADTTSTTSDAQTTSSAATTTQTSSAVALRGTSAAGDESTASSAASAATSTASAASAAASSAAAGTGLTASSAASEATDPTSGAASAANSGAASVATSVASSAATPAANALASSAASSAAPASAAAGTTATTTATTPATGTSAATTAKATSASVGYTDSSVFDWSTDQATASATVTGVNQTVSGIISIPPTYTTNGQTYQVTAIGNAAFASDTGKTTDLTGVIFNQGLTTIGDSAFAYLSNLSSVDFSNDPDLKTIGDLAFVSSGLTQLTLPASVTTIGNEAFTYNSHLTSVTLPASLTSLGTTAFASDEALTSVDLSQATQLTTLSDHAFENDPLTSLTIPANIVTIGTNTFANNLALKTVTFAPDSQLTTIGPSAFIYDGQISQLDLPASLQTIANDAFLANVGLQSVTFGAGLQTIGDNAFTYDGALTTADFSQATQLKTIGNAAFEYAGLNQALTTPASLTSIGDYAFAGNQLTNLTLNNGLTSIGNSAFIYNHLSNALTLPTSLTTVGSQAFYGNELSMVAIPTTTTVGTDAFTYNRINDLTGGTTPAAIANDQAVTTFTDSAHLNLTDLFNLNLGGQTTSNLVVTNMVGDDGPVTLQNGQFVVPTGTNRFTFDWELPAGNGISAYSGQYTVVLDDPNIKVMDSTIFTGTDWTPADNFVSAQTSAGTTVPLANLTVDKGTLNTDVAGTYAVTYSYGNETETATITVVKRNFAVSLQGSQQITYTGSPVTPDAGNYTVSLPNGTQYELLSTAYLSYAATTNVSDTPTTVSLSQAGLDWLNSLPDVSTMYNFTQGTSAASFTVTPAQVTLTINNVVKHAGQPDPALTATVTGMQNNETLDYKLERADGVTPGTYAITAELGSNPNYTVYTTDGTLTIEPTLQSLTGNDYSLYVGDPTPTVTDFDATATDVNGETTPVTLNLGTADLQAPGTYQVTLTAGDLTKTVTLTVLQNQMAINGHDYSMYDTDTAPTLADFGASATDKTGAALTMTSNLATIDATQPGTYQVVLTASDGQTKTVTLNVAKNQQSLTGNDYTLYVGDPTPTATDFNATATDKTGAAEAVTVTLPTSDQLATPGTYTVTLTTADDQSKTVNLVVLPNKATLTGQDATLYVGDPTPTATTFAATATDKTGASQPVNVDLSSVDWTQPNTYAVTLSTADGQKLVVHLDLRANQTAINGQDYTMYVGDPTPTTTDFLASATDKTGSALPVTLDLSQATLTAAGTYPVTLTASDGQTKTVTLTLLANQQSLSAHDYTMYNTDPTPTLTDFGASATDKTGAATTVTSNLSTVNTTVPGTYTVTLNTADGQTKTVQLTVLKNQQSLVAHDYTMYNTDTTPTLTDFGASATDKTGAATTVTSNLSTV